MPVTCRNDTVIDVTRQEETEDIEFADKIVRERYVTRNRVGEWWVMEYDPFKQNAFGFAEISDREAGHFDMAAMASSRIARPDRLVIVIGRGIDWTPRPWSQVDHDDNDDQLPRLAVNLTERLLIGENGDTFDEGGLSNFIVGATRNDLDAQVVIVVDWAKKPTRMTTMTIENAPYSERNAAQ